MKLVSSAAASSFIVILLTMLPSAAWGAPESNSSTKNLRGGSDETPSSGPTNSTTKVIIIDDDEPNLHRNLAACGGGSRGNGVCSAGTCCSQYGWCGTSAAHCSGSGTTQSRGTCGGGSRGNGACTDGTCCSQFGWCGTTAAHCSGGTTENRGTCGGGSRGNGACADGTCCSQYGWCGTTAAHCSSGGGGTTPTGPSPSLPTGGGTSSSGNVLYSGSGSGTYYYDVLGNTCPGEVYNENNGYPSCASFNPAFYKTMQQYGTNNIVAIDNNILSANRQRLCGKQIHVYKNGVEVSGGPYFVWDGCAACIGGGRIDFSLSALNSIDNGQACFHGVVPGISWKVTDKQIQTFIP